MLLGEVYPLNVTVLALPTEADENEAVGEPLTVNVSPFCNPEYDSVPLKVATVVPSYTLLFTVKPVIVKAAVFTVSVAFT